MSKQRVTYVLVQYLQLSETYIRTEIAAIQDDFDVEIISLMPADYPYKDFFPCHKDPLASFRTGESV